MNDIYTEPLSASEPVRRAYADSIQAAISLLRETARLERLATVTPAAMAADREAYREQLASLLGVTRCQAVFGSEPPSADEREIGRDPLCTVRRIALQLAPGVDFSGLFLIPHVHEGRMPLAVMTHGGGGSPELCCDLLGSNNYGGVARKLLARGYAVFAPRLLLWNLSPKLCESNIPMYETRYDRKARDNDFKQVGSSLVGFEIYGIMRALDYLLAKEDIDRNRCGMLGLSYGGFYTLYTMACDTRIKAGWSAAFFNDRIRYNWQDFVWSGSASGFLDPEVVGLCAPRRLILDIGKADTVFDYASAVPLFERTKAFYEEAGASSRLTVHLWEGEHRFCPDSLPLFQL